MAVPKLDEERQQLREDVLDIYIRRTKKMSEFPPDRQVLMADYYRFMAHRYESFNSYVAPRTHDTLDII